MRFTFASFSDAGPRRANEDSVLSQFTDDGGCLLAVADGLGGHFGGADASKMAIDLLATAELSTADAFESVFREIHQAIVARQESDPASHGMATTLTAAKLKGSRIIGAHCGDTRCVLQRGAGIKKLTVEHTEAQRLFDAGKLTKEQLLTYPRRNILDSALGVGEGLRIDIFEHDLERGDRVLITSDGVHEIIRARGILTVLRDSSSVDHAVAEIRNAVETAGAEDNFSAACAFADQL